MADIFDLSGRVAVITGGSRGLGREMAFAFAERGADVVIASRKADACEAVAAEISAATGRRAEGIGCHVGRWDECTALAEAAIARFGRVDILVNNAGMSPPYASISDVTEDLYDKVLAVNLKGPFRLAVLLGTHMAEHGGGSIINVSSTAAITPSPAEVPYGMAKSALNNMTAGLARAFAPKVRVNGIMPGPFLTDISKAWDMDLFERTAKQTIPLGRGGRPNEIIGAALYLASDASSYTTGSILRVDGGQARLAGSG